MDAPYSHVLTEVAELPGHEDRAWQVAWNPVRPLLASCSADKSVRLYAYRASDPSTSGAPGLSFTALAPIPTGHAKTVRGIAWAPSGATLATASFDANIGIWEQEAADEDGAEDGDGAARTGEWECMSTLEGHETECKSVAYSASGTLLASCSRDKTVWIWEVHPDSDFECMAVLMEHTQDVKCVAWHPSEEILASASYDDTIKLYIDDPSEDWYCATSLPGHASTVWALAWAPDGGYLASASADCTIRIWKRQREWEWACVRVLEGHERAVYSIAWGRGADGTGLGWLASAGADGRVNVWELSETAGADAPTATLIARRDGAHDVHDVNSVAWCPRAGLVSVLATAGDDGCVRVWEVHAAPVH